MCKKFKNACDFLLFLIGIRSKTALFTKVLFICPPLALRLQKWYRVFAKQSTRKANKQANVRYQFTFVFFIFKICAKKGKNTFSLNNFSWFFQEKTFFETWPYFLWKCVSYLLKQFAIQIACPRRNFFKPKWRNLCFKTIKSGSNLHFQANLQCFISLLLFSKRKQF